MDTKIDELARQERIEYFRKWRANNKDKVQQHNKTYWQKRAQKRIEGEHNGTSKN